MAITRAQQVRQMLNGGGAPSNRGDIGRDEPSRGESLHGGRSVTDAVKMGELKALAKTGPGSDLETGRGRENLEALEALSVQDSSFPGAIGMGLNLFKGPRQKLLRRNVDFFINDPRTRKAREKYGLTAQGYQDYMSDRLAGTIDAAGNLLNQDDDDSSSPLFPLTGIMAQAPSNMDQEPETEENEGLRLAFRAEGGPIGGEYDFESARQMYGLGKLVKKVTRTVKKIAKSPIGKAAIIGGLGAYGLGALGAKSFAPSAAFNLANIGKGFAASKGFLADKLLGPRFIDTGGEVFRSGGLFSKIPGGGVTAAIAGTSLLAGLLTAEQEEEAQELSRGEGIDIEAARRSILNAGTARDFRARGFRAEGGPAEGKEPVAKKTMPLLDMGGKEMDLREEGGFVPIGRMEKADDVPARLSKNEFVFTADAVRNAGDGNVDKGAEVMYNMMKNLEAGGEVSEESQGLEGARKMFQTSQRLEEVL